MSKSQTVLLNKQSFDGLLIGLQLITITEVSTMGQNNNNSLLENAEEFNVVKVPEGIKTLKAVKKVLMLIVSYLLF